MVVGPSPDRGGHVRTPSSRRRPNLPGLGDPPVRGGPQPGGPTAGPPTLVDVSEGWNLEARCREEDAALFFGPNGFEPKRERLAREGAAKAICRTCPAVTVCREYALSQVELYGVWGGLGEADRRELLARRGIVAHAV
jgi:WhiB family transcriptional regulator, redox-sensing transcriptional regulator